jgi:hypothetical protein
MWMKHLEIFAYGHKPHFWHTAVLMAMLALNSAQAQPASTTKTIKVTIKGSEQCTDQLLGRKQVVVVLKGDESDIVRAFREKDSEPWFGVINKDIPIMASKTRASLRLSGLRTDCRESVRIPDPENEEASVASFTFDCQSTEVRQVTLSAVLEEDRRDPIKLGYVRRPSAACMEWRFSDEDPQPVADMWPSEDLRLHLGWMKPDPVAPGGLLAPAGLLVFSRSSGGLLAFNMPGQRHARETSNKTCFDRSGAKDDLCLDRDGVVLTLRDQRAKGDGSAPTFSPSAMDIDFKKLKAAGVKGLVVTVK